VRAYAGAGACKREVVGERGADEHSEHEGAGVGVAFTRHYEHPSGAASGECEGEAGKRHSEEVPKLHRVGDGLILKPRLELPEREVRREGGDYEGRDALEEMGVPYHDEVAQGADRAEARTLGQPSDDEAGGKRDERRRVRRAGALFREEYRPRAFRAEQRLRKKESQDSGREERHHEAGRFRRRARGSEAEAPIEEPHPYGYPADEPRYAGDRVEVAAGEAKVGAPRAAEEYEGAGHREEAEREANHRGRTAARLIFRESERGGERAYDEARYLRAQILHDGGAVQAEGACDVAREAGDAEAHIARVAEFHEKRPNDAEHGPGDRGAVF